MIKEFIYNWKTKRTLKGVSHTQNISFDKAKSIGLLFDDDSDYIKSKDFINALINDGKKITVLIKSKEKETILSDHFTDNQCKWYGKIDSEFVNKFLNSSFDYLFLLNNNPHFLTEYILASSKAVCKVGLHNEKKEAFYELMFENNKNESIPKFHKTIKDYLYKIKS